MEVEVATHNIMVESSRGFLSEGSEPPCCCCCMGGGGDYSGFCNLLLWQGAAFLESASYGFACVECGRMLHPDGWHGGGGPSRCPGVSSIGGGGGNLRCRRHRFLSEWKRAGLRSDSWSHRWGMMAVMDMWRLKMEDGGIHLRGAGVKHDKDTWLMFKWKNDRTL